MPIDDKLTRQLLALFTVEAEEHLQTINQDLLALEQHPEPKRTQSLLADIFRAAHTIKGSARSVNLESVGTLGHRLETLFGRVQKGELQLSPPVFDLIYEALDAIATLVRAAASGAQNGLNVAELSARLDAAAALPIAAVTLPLSPDNATAAGTREASLAASAEPVGAIVPYASAQPNPPAADVRVQPSTLPAAESPLPGIEPTVRIATAKLDALLAQLGELQVTRISAEQRVVDLRALLDSVEAWEGEWRKARVSYRRLLTGHADSTAAMGQASELGMAGDARDVGPVLEFLQSNETHLRLVRARLNDLQRAMQTDSHQMAQVAGDLQDDVRRARMMPVAVVFDAFPRMVRDLVRDLNKEVTLEIHGAETEVDRTLLEQIKAPLLHLLRNAVDHGIEEPARREQAGKPRIGRIVLGAAQRGSNIFIDVADDGAGIDPARVKASAVKRGLLSAEAADALSDQEALWLIFRSGMSTRTLISDVSGRGVGLDVVRENIDRLQGLISIDSRVGYGTRFTLQLPLTIATTLCLLARASDQTFALPVANVTHLLRVTPADIGQAQNRQTIIVDGRPVVLAHLADLLALERKLTGEESRQIQPAIILGAADRLVALAVDALLGAQEMVIKNLPKPFMRVNHTAGAAIMGTGAVVLVLNAADLLRSVSRSPVKAALSPAAAENNRRAASIIIADDSITTRTLEKNILEVAGYHVRAASDGLEAWTLLQSEPCDLLVSDVQMPRMDGFSLTEKVRADERFKQLPVILVTSLASREDRERGVQAGADAYIVKSAFDQDMLLSTIRQLI